MKIAKKIVLLTGVFSLVLLSSPSVYAAKKNASTGEAASSTQNESNGLKSTSKKAEKKAERNAAKAMKKNKKEASPFDSLYENDASDDMSKETAFSSKTIEVADGKLKILMKGAVGSFQFYTLDNDDKAIPLLSGNDEFTSSFYALKVGKKNYRLANNIGVVLGARGTENGGQMVYVIPKVARVLLTYEFLSSYQGELKDILKITARVLNQGKRADAFSLKAVLDTYLGEQKGPHFSMADAKKINKEVQLRKYDSAKWILSANDKASMQILICGADITVPEVVSLANKDLISMTPWIPSVNGTKNFDSVISYNNSGVCINWSSVTLAPDEEASFIYYVAVAAGDEEPQGEKFIEGLESLYSRGEKEGTSTSIADEQNFERASSQIYIAPEKLTREYIQSLVDRINALESDSQMVDRSEIMMLNAELDIILEKLRQM